MSLNLRSQPFWSYWLVELLIVQWRLACWSLMMQVLSQIPQYTSCPKFVSIERILWKGREHTCNPPSPMNWFLADLEGTDLMAPNFRRVMVYIGNALYTANAVMLKHHFPITIANPWCKYRDTKCTGSDVSLSASLPFAESVLSWCLWCIIHSSSTIDTSDASHTLRLMYHKLK